MKSELQDDGSYKTEISVYQHMYLSKVPYYHKNKELTKYDWIKIIDDHRALFACIPKKYRTAELALHYKLRWT